MKQSFLENNGLKASLLGYGGMRFPTDGDGKIIYDKAKALIDRAYKAGVNYYDTAVFYHNGESESFFGRAFEEYDRDTYLFATKLPVWNANNGEDVLRIFNEQCGRLKTERVEQGGIAGNAPRS